MADVLTWIDATWRTWTEPAAWMLLHAVWQGALVAAVAAVGLELLRRARPEARYALACAALALMIVLPVATTLWGPLSVGTAGPAGMSAAPSAAPAAPASPSALASPSAPGAAAAAPLPSSPEASTNALSASSGASSGAGGWAGRASAAIAPFAPWGVAAWALGVLLLSLRTLGGALYLHRLRGRTSPASRALRRRADAIGRRLRLSGPVPVRTSRHVDTPMALGWWKPLVLLPASLATGCPPDQLDALLAHELAHVRRHDVLVGWLQAAAETLLSDLRLGCEALLDSFMLASTMQHVA